MAARSKKTDHLLSSGKKSAPQKIAHSKKINFDFSDDSESDSENSSTSQDRIQRALRELNIETGGGKQSMNRLAFTLDKSIIASDDLRRRSELPSLCEELGHPIIESTRLCSTDSFSESLAYHTALDEDLEADETDDKLITKSIFNGRTKKSVSQVCTEKSVSKTPEYYRVAHRRMMETTAQKKTANAGKENNIPNHFTKISSENMSEPTHRSVIDCSLNKKSIAYEKQNLDWDDLPESPLGESKPAKKLGSFKVSCSLNSVSSDEWRKDRVKKVNSLMHGQLSVLKKKIVDNENIHHTKENDEKLESSVNSETISTESSSESYIEVQDMSVQTSYVHEYYETELKHEDRGNDALFKNESCDISLQPSTSKEEFLSFADNPDCSLPPCPPSLPQEDGSSQDNFSDKSGSGKVEDASETLAKNVSEEKSRNETDTSGEQDLYKTALCGADINESSTTQEELEKQSSCSSTDLSSYQESDQLNSNSQSVQSHGKEKVEFGENPPVSESEGESVLSSPSSSYEVQDISVQTSLILTPLAVNDSDAEEADQAGISENQKNTETPYNFSNETQGQLGVDKQNKDALDDSDSEGDDGDEKDNVLVSASDSENENGGQTYEKKNTANDEIEESEDSQGDGPSGFESGQDEVTKLTSLQESPALRSKPAKSMNHNCQEARHDLSQSPNRDESKQDFLDVSCTEDQNTVIKKEVTSFDKDLILVNGKKIRKSRNSNSQRPDQKELDLDDLTERLGAFSLPSHKQRFESESSDDDIGFENFLSKVKKTIKSVDKPEDESDRPFLEEFIVNDEEDELSESDDEGNQNDTDDELFYIKTTNKINNASGKQLRHKEVTYTQYHSGNSASNSEEESDSDLDGFIVDKPAKRSYTKSLIPVFDLSSDEEDLLGKETQRKISMEKPTNLLNRKHMPDDENVMFDKDSSSLKTPRKTKLSSGLQPQMKESHLLEPDDDDNDFKTPFKRTIKTPKILKPWERSFETPANKHSAQKVFKTPTNRSEFSLHSKTAPRPSRPSNIGLDDNSYFLKSLSADYADYRRHPDAARFVSKFKDRRADLTQKLFRIFNHAVFEEKLPADFEIEWNARYTKTAGTFYYKGTKDKFIAKVTLSAKVCDSPERVRDTLAHELCHAAVKLINGANESHGRIWQSWARRTNRAFPFMPVIARCHDYIINTRYTYQCVSCKYRIGRHSKSLDTDKKVCGHCRGRFEVYLTKELNSSNEEGSKTPATPRTPRTPNKFALFVKECYSEVKKREADMRHADVMKILSKEFAEKNRICESN